MALHVYIGGNNVYRIRLIPTPQIYQFPNALFYKEFVVWDDRPLEFLERHWWKNHFYNVVAWVRMTARRDVDNKILAFIEEIQSDWSRVQNSPVAQNWLQEGLLRLRTWCQNQGAERLGWIDAQAIADRFNLETTHPTIHQIYDVRIKQFWENQGYTPIQTSIDIRRNGTQWYQVWAIDL